MDKNLIVSGFIQINNDLISAEDIEPLSERSGSTCLCYLVRYQGKRYFMKRLRREYADNPRYLELFRKEGVFSLSCWNAWVICIIIRCFILT